MILIKNETELKEQVAKLFDPSIWRYVEACRVDDCCVDQALDALVEEIGFEFGKPMEKKAFRDCLTDAFEPEF